MDKQEFDLRSLVMYLERENNIDQEIILSSIETAIRTAARKNPNLTNDFRVEIDRTKMEIHMYDTFVVSETEVGSGFITPRKAMVLTKTKYNDGDVVEIEIPPASLGRVVAKITQQVVKQKINEAKRSNIFSDNKDRIGQIVTGIVHGVVRGDVIVQCGRSEMVLPKNEQIHKEKYKVGDSIRAMIVRVDPKAKVSPVILSRSSNRFLEELMRIDIEEVNTGDIEIMAISRDPGFRAKVAVRSNRPKIDPVGSCIGRGGCRIKLITNELSGEHIDIVRYDENIKNYIASALLPGVTDKITFNPTNDNDVLVTVSKEEYPKVIGRNGQNVKLASDITHMHITVKRSMETMTFEEQKEYSIENMSDMFGISETVARTIVESGYLTPDGIATDDFASFKSATGLDEIVASGIYSAASAISGMINI